MPPVTYWAAGYVRQSRKRHDSSEASPDTQRAANRARADQMDAQWVGSYEDLGISAYNGADRPEFDRLVSDCHAGRVNLILVYNISRLSRLDPLDAIPVVTDLLNRGVTLVSIMEGEFRKGNLMDLIHLIMRLDAAYRESKNKSDAVRGAKERALTLGGYVGGKPPFGFRMRTIMRTTEDRRAVAIQLLERDEEEAAIVRRVVAEMLDQDHPTTLTAIATRLNREGVPTRGTRVGKNTAGSAWCARTLGRIVRDPRIAGYAAEVIYSQRPRPDGRKSASVAGYRIVRDDNGEPVSMHPEIVSPEVWYELQARLDGRPTPAAPAGPRAPALLSSLGILYCECGHKMKSHRNHSRKFLSAHRCTRPAGLRRPYQHAGDCTISMAGLDDYVARRIFALIATAEDDPETLEILEEATRLFGLITIDPALSARRGAAVGDLGDAERALNQLYDDRASGGYSGEIGKRRFLQAERALTTRIEALTAQIAEIDAMNTPTLPIAQWVGEPGSDPVGPGSWWHSAPLAERRALVKIFVRRITVRKMVKGITTRPPVDRRVEIEWVTPESAGEWGAGEDLE